MFVLFLDFYSILFFLFYSISLLLVFFVDMNVVQLRFTSLCEEAVLKPVWFTD